MYVHAHFAFYRRGKFSLRPTHHVSRVYTIVQRRGGARFSELGGPGRVVVDFPPLPLPFYPPQKTEFARILWLVLLEAK